MKEYEGKVGKKADQTNYIVFSMLKEYLFYHAL